MPENTIKPAPKKRGSLGRKLVWIAGILIVLVVVLYLVVTSTAFFKGVILPRAGKALNADITVTDANISPFSQVRFHSLKVTPRGREQLMEVQDIHANYSLWDILGGRIVVSEAVVDSPVITVIQNADGTSNLDPLTQKSDTNSKPARRKNDSAAKKPTQVDIKKIALNNATVRLVKKYNGGGRDVTEMTGLNFTVTNLKNGQAGKIELAAALAMEKAMQTNAAAGALRGKLAGGFDFALTPDLKFATASGNTTFTVEQATGPLADLNGLAAKFDCELTPTELKQLALHLAKADAVLGEIRAHGPFDTAKSEGKIRLEVLGIDKQALNLIGAASGMDFGGTSINSTNDIEFSQGGHLISVAGRMDMAHFQITRQGRSSPTLDLHGDYEVTVDQSASTANVKTLNLTGTQNSQPLLQGGLSSPMTIAWGNANSNVGDAALNLIITNLNLTDWKGVTDETGPEGTVAMQARLVSQKSGKQLGFELAAQLKNLATGSGNARVNQGDLQLQAGGTATDLKQFKLDNYQLELARQGTLVLKISGQGTYDSTTRDADFQIGMQTTPAQLLAKPGLQTANDTVNLNARVTNKQNKITVDGQLLLAPTTRAKNELHLNGSVDLAQATAITGSIKVTADALDVTSYYELFSGTQTGRTNSPNVNAPGGATTASAANNNQNQEPGAITLPLKNFTFDLNIGHLYLREVDIANWQTTALVDGGHLLLKPCQFTINNAPVKATVDLNLGVPGYTYDVAFSAEAVPLAPLVNSFAPDRKGQIAGTTTADGQIKGAGITGASLQKNLAGKFEFGATNLNLSIANVRSPLLKSIVNTVIALPDLLQNPTAALGNLLGGSHKSGWTDQLTASPIDVIGMQAEARDGKVQLTSSEVRSAAFQALATGDITLDPVLTNSAIHIPVQVRLSRALGNQIGLVNADTPTNAAYVALPDFLKETGTVGKPKTETDKGALMMIAAKAGGSIGERFGGATGEKSKSVVNSVEGLFGNKPANTNSAPRTNAPSPASDLLNLFKK